MMLAHTSDYCGVTTSRNLLLRRLSREDGALLRPYVEHVVMPLGARMLDPQRPIDAVFFPEAGLVALEDMAGGAGAVEVAIVGREGMIGWPALLGCGRSVQTAVCRAQDGRAVRIEIEPLRAACRESATLSSVLLAFVQDLMVQMARTIVAQSDGSLEQRIARWLLMRHDRVGGDQIMACHNEISNALNVRRASITDRLHVLEGMGLIRCRRGRVFVRDRAALTSCAGSLYGAGDALVGQALRPTAPVAKRPVILM